LTDVLFLKASWSVTELFFVSLLAVAIIGLKLSAPE
jgi:hypothetical protein